MVNIMPITKIMKNIIPIKEGTIKLLMEDIPGETDVCTDVMKKNETPNKTNISNIKPRR